MSKVTIRQATPQDMESLCRLYLAFHEFHARGVPDRLVSLGPFETYDSAKLVAGLHKIMDDNDAAVFIASADDQIVGLAEVYVRQDKPDPACVCRRYGYLQSLMVLEPFRQHGLGLQLLQTAEQWAFAQNASEMRLDIWEFEAGPLGFYEKAGYYTLKRTLIKKADNQNEPNSH